MVLYKVKGEERRADGRHGLRYHISHHIFPLYQGVRFDGRIEDGREKKET